ncbi:hypothetical protein CEXT_727811 [Caerostris extrusa]|uniref:Uncharacterized protein n=1 Tax=Caerostris extrusa TaxID=172846 RepID=A0AAV4XID3_CAEEX|nr:hypothetical protein CEXT_727811 [Caerostris extrusa]
MFFEVVVCAFIGIVAVLAILTLWRKKHSRFVPDNKHSVFQVLVDAMDSILFVTSERRTPCISDVTGVPTPISFQWGIHGK